MSLTFLSNHTGEESKINFNFSQSKQFSKKSSSTLFPLPLPLLHHQISPFILQLVTTSFKLATTSMPLKDHKVQISSFHALRFGSTSALARNALSLPSLLNNSKNMDVRTEIDSTYSKRWERETTMRMGFLVGDCATSFLFQQMGFLG